MPGGITAVSTSVTTTNGCITQFTLTYVVGCQDVFHPTWDIPDNDYAHRSLGMWQAVGSVTDSLGRNETYQKNFHIRGFVLQNVHVERAFSPPDGESNAISFDAVGVADAVETSGWSPSNPPSGQTTCKVTIYERPTSSTSNTIRTLSSTTPLSYANNRARVSLTWDGQDSSGQVQFGKYPVRLEVFAQEAIGRPTEAHQTCVVKPVDAIAVTSFSFRDPDQDDPSRDNAKPLWDYQRSVVIEPHLWQATWDGQLNGTVTETRSDPVAYVRSLPGIPRKIQLTADLQANSGVPTPCTVRVQLTGVPRDPTRPTLTFQSADGEDYVVFDVNNWTDDDSANLKLICTRELPSTVALWDYQFQWKIRCTKGPLVTPPPPVQTTPVQTGEQNPRYHRIYVLYDEPVLLTVASDGSPADATYPWSRTLDDACQWADGKSTTSDILTALTTNLWTHSGHIYDGGVHCTRYSLALGSEVFYLKKFLDKYYDTPKYITPPSGPTINFAGADCRDLSNYLLTMSRALGVSGPIVRRFPTGATGFLTKYIRPHQEQDMVSGGQQRGDEPWQRSYASRWFSNPPPGETVTVSGRYYWWFQVFWNFHQIVSSNGWIWDACLRVDNSPPDPLNPNNVDNERAISSAQATGLRPDGLELPFYAGVYQAGSEAQPTGLDSTTYLQRVVLTPSSPLPSFEDWYVVPISVHIPNSNVDPRQNP
jgi:hypothetical protein